MWLRPPLVVGSYPYNGKKGLNLYGVVTEKRQVQTMIVCAAFVAAADALVNPSERHVPCQTSKTASVSAAHFAPASSLHLPKLVIVCLWMRLLK